MRWKHSLNCEEQICNGRSKFSERGDRPCSRRFFEWVLLGDGTDCRTGIVLKRGPSGAHVDCHAMLVLESLAEVLFVSERRLPETFEAGVVKLVKLVPMGPVRVENVASRHEIKSHAVSYEIG